MNNSIVPFESHGTTVQTITDENERRVSRETLRELERELLHELERSLERGLLRELERRPQRGLQRNRKTDLWAMVDAPVNTVKARYDWERDQLDIVTIDGDQLRLDARQAAALAHWLVALAIPHTIEGGAA